ncbi:MAG: hypothetical protein ACOX8W_09225 [bacterium]
MAGVDVLLKVREAEQESERRTGAAKAQASGIVSEAKKKAKQIMDDAVAAANQEGRELIKKAEADAVLAIEQARSERDEAIGKIKEAAQANMEKAVTLIAERIVR